MSKQIRTTYCLRIREKIKAILRRESKRTGRSMASLIEQAVEQTYQKPKP